MHVVLIAEDNHGDIGVAASMAAAKRFLLAKNWVDAHTMVYVEERERWFSLVDLYGENWKEAYMGFDTDLLADMGFYFLTEEVYEEEN